ncbi:MAG: CapA family protein [Solobacterium sp.]|nr:CapA family protein [Solobacterium sp.]
MSRTWIKAICAALCVMTLGGCSGTGTSSSAAAEPTPEPTPEPPVVYEASLFLTGDALLHGTVWKDLDANGNYRFADQMSYIGALASSYDLRYYNQETILAGEEFGYSGYPMFNSPQAFGDVMADTYGFNLVSTANNHSFDRFAAGIHGSNAFWHSKPNVHMAGTYDSWEEQREIPVYEVNGITYTFLSWTFSLNGMDLPEGEEYLVNHYEGRIDEMLDQIRQADAKSDVVIMAIHWGVEYSMEASDEQRELAQQMVDAGADIIIGNHPHVIQPIEHIGNAICFYAMGNVISAQLNLENLIGMIGALKITKTVQGEATDIRISDVKADLIYTYYDGNFKNFQVIPLALIDDSQLSNHQEIYERFAGKITEYDPTIQFGGF